MIVGGATGVVRVGTSFARAIQTGYLRAYALLLLLGVAGAGPLLPARPARDDPPVDRRCSCRSPRACSGAFLPRAAGALGGARRHASLVLAYAIALLVDFDSGPAGSST